MDKWKIILCAWIDGGIPGNSVVKNPPANAGDTSLIPGVGRSPGEGNGNPFQYSGLEDLWQRSLVGNHGVAKQSDTTEQLNNDNNMDWKNQYH